MRSLHQYLRRPGDATRAVGEAGPLASLQGGCRDGRTVPVGPSPPETERSPSETSLITPERE